MIAEKPSWIKHGGTQIFSIDIQPGGLRFATGGGDNKVRIWNMKCVGRERQTDASASKLLATLHGHFEAVNCVRWAKHGRYIASGSDDHNILIHERMPGSGTMEFGSGEPPNVENWKVTMTLRGHTADVVDLNWSPDGSTLVSGSLDKTIHVWEMSSGVCAAVLRGHSSLVKGVAWDPIGSFVASQSDDKTVIIWRTRDWSIAHRTVGHWAKSFGSTFVRRLDWSPCGHFVTTTHGFQKPTHCAPVLERGDWSAKFDFLGHKAPIIVAKFNPSMFRRNFSNPRGLKKGSSKTEKKDRQPYNVIAIGSQDRTITVWTTSSPRPLFIAKQFFSQSIVDLTWSPDGYSLFACSLDGTIATFHFDVNEIGKRLTDAQLEKLKRSRYGDVRARQGDLAETAAQLLLEAAKQTSIEKSNTVVPVSLSSPKPCADLAVKAKTKTDHTNVNDGKKIDDAIIDGSHEVGSTRMSSPIKQKEYIRPDGRKRIIPEAIGVTAHQERTSIGEGVLDLSMKSLDRNNNDKGVLYDGSIRVTEKVPSSRGKEGNNNVEQIGYIAPGNILSIRVFDKKQGDDDTVPFCLEARPRENADDTEVYCTKGSQNLWSDKISGKVTVLAGNCNFWAVGSEDGCLQVYTKCGKRAMPTMMVGSAAVFIDCDELWKLLLVTRKGSLYVWDLFTRKCLLHDTLVSLITTDMTSNDKDTGSIKVISAKLSKSGSPLVVLATREAYLFDMSLMCWLRVADDCFASSWTLGSAHEGELAALQVDVRKFLARKPGCSRVTDDGVHTRAHLETQLASSLALMSPNEYRECLISYIRFLASEADETRLREICEDFLGPPIGIGETGSDVKTPAWDPFVLGMNKHKLLREDILPAMASNRKVQRLLNEFIDLLSEYETTETNIEHSNPALPSADKRNPNSTPDIDSVDDHNITDPMDIVPSFVSQTDQTVTETPEQMNLDP